MIRCGGPFSLFILNLQPMSGVSLPVNRPMGRALVVGSAANRGQPVEILQRLYSFDCAQADDPYSAMLELCRRKVVYSAMVLSLASLYREELGIIGTVKRRFPHLEVWLTHTDGRQAALAEAMRLGADGLLGEDGLHRIAPTTTVHEPRPLDYLHETDEDDADRPNLPASADAPIDEPRPREEPAIGEPVLTPDELRALLQDQPAMPPTSTTSDST
jgi:hypothetical protein